MKSEHTTQLKVNTGVFKGYSEGQVLTLPCDEKGTVKDRFWRRRLKDAKRDGCCEIVTATKPKPKARAAATTEGVDNG